MNITRNFVLGILFLLPCSFVRAEEVGTKGLVSFFQKRDIILEVPETISTWKGRGTYYYVNRKEFFKISKTVILEENTLEHVKGLKFFKQHRLVESFQDVELEGVIILPGSEEQILFAAGLFWKLSNEGNQFSKSPELSKLLIRVNY